MQYSQNVVDFFINMLNLPEQAQTFRKNRTLFLSAAKYPPDTPGTTWPTLTDTDQKDIMDMSFEDVNRWNYTFTTDRASGNGTDKLTGDVQALHGNGIPFMNQVHLDIVVNATEIYVKVDAHTPDGGPPPGNVETGIVHIVGVISTTDAAPLLEQENLILIQPDSSVVFDTEDPHYQNRTHVKANGYIKLGTGNNDGVISLAFNENIDTPVHSPETEKSRAKGKK